VYETSCRDEDLIRKYDWSTAVLFRRGRVGDVLNRHHALATLAVRAGMGAIRDAAPHLVRVIADARTMKLAWDYLARYGGAAPGPNGHRFARYSEAEAWERCRVLARTIRAGSYRPGGERIVMKQKESGNGERPIVLMDIEDRVVQRAIVLVLQPLLDPLFDPRAFGFRPGRDYRHALVTAEWLAAEEGRWVWVSEDLKDAFSHVPVGRLLQVIRNLLPADDLLDLLGIVVPAQSGHGLRQGGSLSPLLLMVYLNKFLDRPWRRAHPDWPLVRVADDIVVLCRSDDEALGAYADLTNLLRPTGMLLKGKPETAVFDLTTGEAAWLGLGVRRDGGRLALRMMERSWRRLDRTLAEAHLKPRPTLRARATIRGWLAARGCCYPWADPDTVSGRVAETAAARGFDEIPGRRALLGVFRAAHARWCRFHAAQRERLAASASAVSMP